MVTYWLEGKKMPLVIKDVAADAKTTKHVTMETEAEREADLYASVPGCLNHDLLKDQT